ncbi:DUF397 domain-containing protein [Saccharopolyspora spinosa]|uniref:Uncharacterized protein DUF397 n=1 Tax=Saccharopolyspora spinosa TaxID=60894 RepID=A0A2N3XSR8_SACSN|nr:DUF397 domain-containing protein [Saccharopolyspora spinosa]PKW13737.1 uncharacterized protein DUF397 [Saccharopolyspora spinosa]
MTSVTGWRKSSHSQNSGDCVEVGRLAAGAAVRDSKDAGGGYFVTTPMQWGNFVAALKAGRFEC